MGALSALVGGQLWSLVLVALLAAWRPWVRLLLAAAVASIAATILVFGPQTTPPEHGAILAAGAMLLAGVALWIRRRVGDAADWPSERVPGWLVAGLARRHPGCGHRGRAGRRGRRPVRHPCLCWRLGPAGGLGDRCAVSR